MTTYYKRGFIRLSCTIEARQANNGCLHAGEPKADSISLRGAKPARQQSQAEVEGLEASPLLILPEMPSCSCPEAHLLVDSRSNQVDSQDERQTIPRLSSHPTITPPVVFEEPHIWCHSGHSCLHCSPLCIGLLCPVFSSVFVLCSLADTAYKLVDYGHVLSCLPPPRTGCRDVALASLELTEIC